MSYLQNGLAWTAGVATTIVVAIGFLVAAPSPSSATLAEFGESCLAVLGGDHCCACGNSGSGWFCTEIAQSAFAACNDSVGLCTGECAGSVD